MFNIDTENILAVRTQPTTLKSQSLIFNHYFYTVKIHQVQ